MPSARARRTKTQYTRVLVGLARLDHEQVIASCAEAIASGEVAAERRARARMQRHQAALTELAAAHDEAFIGQVVALQSNRFRDAEARGGQEPEQVMVGQRTDHPVRRKSEGGSH